jgi:hypothetical protein
MGGLIEDCATQLVGDRCVLERFVLEKYTRCCMKKKEKENGSQGIESPYIHNFFFLPRD